MTTLVLRTAGSLIGAALLGPVGAAIGGVLGSAAGFAIDSKLFGSGGSSSYEGSRLTDLQVQTSTEGGNIPRIYGRVRLNGQVIWATQFVEKVTKREQKTGASKGGGGSKVTQTTYSYYANFAVALCEGEIAHIGRIWANGTALDLKDISYRVYKGAPDQMPDSLIEAKQGSDNCPAYRGLAYIVFEELPLEGFGNRLPQLSFEVIKPVGTLEKQITAMVMIPGATEFGYDTTEVNRRSGDGQWASENRHSYEPGTDFAVSLDHLCALCPNLERIALVTTWFGTDLRAAHCSIEPMVNASNKQTDEYDWSVAGLDREGARQVAQIDGRAAFGGTPSDASIKRAIAAIKERGLEVVLYPFIMMDIAPDNSLPDPYGRARQPAFPWRGRITCDPAPSMEGSADRTADAAAQVAVFFSEQIWSYRRFILHYAALAKEAGGVDAFLLGSELRGLSWIRGEDGSYPFVSALCSLAADVRAIVGSRCKLTYGADWSEYFGHQPATEPGMVRFHLDPLWADANIDAIGIDNYMPTSDWRAGLDHLDADLSDNGIDNAYLQANIAGGEGFDWYYASKDDRDNQIRTPITDGDGGKSWIYRYKDLVSWWSNPHFDRTDGVEHDNPTDWQAASKPIWFTELGAAAVHLATNQPNIFPDGKSSENGLPYHSSGARDDAVQRAHIGASLAYWASSDTSRNPVSPIYGAPMVNPDQIYLWAWDARPFPAFPVSLDVWSDGSNWQTGHWLNGRLGSAPLGNLIEAICTDYGLDTPAVEALAPVIDGYILDRRMSARSALETLCDAFAIAVTESAGRLSFKSRGKRAALNLEETGLVEQADEPLNMRKIASWEQQASSVTIGFNELFYDYRHSVARFDQPSVRSSNDQSLSLAITSSLPVMQEVARTWLRDKSFGRHSLSLMLPPSMLDLEAGDLVVLTAEDREQLYHIDAIEDGVAREVEMSLASPHNVVPRASAPRYGSMRTPSIIQPVVEIMDLPTLPLLADRPHAPYLAIYANPWPGGITVQAGTAESGFGYLQTVNVPAIMGVVQKSAGAGPLYRFDHASNLEILLLSGSLSSISNDSLLAGNNAAAIKAENGAWEIIQFQNAELIEPNLWQLTTLLRGQLGTEEAALSGIAAGARFVLLDEAISPLEIAESQLEKALPFRFVPSGGDIAAKTNLDATIQVTGRGLKPYAPVHARLKEDDTTGDWHFSWIRRARLEADSWVGANIPLIEEGEAYRLRLYLGEGGALIREVETYQPHWTYSAAERLSDGIEGVASAKLEIVQMSSRVGEGFPLNRVLTSGPPRLT